MKARGAVRLLPQAAVGVEQRPRVLMCIKIHSDMAHAQDGQQGFAAQRQVSLQLPKRIFKA